MATTQGNRLLLGVGLGVVLAGVIRQIAPSFRGLGRPLAKAAVKSTLTLVDRGRLRAAEMLETIEDLAAESRAEMAAEAALAQTEGTPEEQEYAAQSAYHA